MEIVPSAELEVSGPGFEDLDVGLLDAQVRFSRHEQGWLFALLGPGDAALVEAVVDPGDGPGRCVLADRAELPVGGAEAHGTLEGNMRQLGQAQQAWQVVVRFL